MYMLMCHNLVNTCYQVNMLADGVVNKCIIATAGVSMDANIAVVTFQFTIVM